MSSARGEEAAPRPSPTTGGGTSGGMSDDGLLGLLHECADLVRGALDGVEDWGLTGTKAGQYHLDVAADTVVLDHLLAAGLGLLSEETGVHHPERPLFAVVDPVDGSTNASRRLPWFATSICVLDADGPRAALVANQASGQRFTAVRGGGAHLDGTPIAASGATRLGESLVSLCGWPARHLGWRQMRSYGAAALDLCAVASGSVDAYVDCTPGLHGAWDYLGGLLVCAEAGAVTADVYGRDMVVRGHADRRCPVAAATPELLAELRAARLALDGSVPEKSR